ncbi:pelargonidin 3-O-(6-caffeoylglucoside) 5-O-(6-O-malonylglucoside) 4'''-malonyltransferase-like [Salvia miltiorrhiza]|uniref:pelargonidin 3-O-(6-caffeoylglucoside) 5-O-(6-O-malonylglucoside) 4'''-malonyltransferase-like n=1 Tax=Salvia miltiorrhiza TaxID=226208 RepID=UPI0025ACAB27|nr:pelargonidin 3-O-(6-caffeoylglucoside) 5-O-(6-O-malonylglucoside) 4'''-malonyltransferase-like [Salvia miltiorrhiza]
MKVEVKSRNLVKPATATPSHLRLYKISMIDDLNPPIHVIRILYYPPHSPTLNLEPSLAQILPAFYPLAGRYLKHLHAVDCNDAGAHFSHALVHSHLHHLLSDRAFPTSRLNALLPVAIAAADGPADPMLAVQINTFLCGGVALAVCASHRIFDACSLNIFLAAWANAATGGQLTMRPDFSSPALFPSESADPLEFGVGERRIVGRRIVFDKNAISRLRAHADLDGGKTPSRVVAVSTALTQALLRADTDKREHEGGPARAALITHAINVRERTVPPVAKHACGTWVSMSHVEIAAGERGIAERDFPKLVRKMREATVRGVEDCARILSEREFGRRVLVDSYAEIAEKGLRGDYKVIYVTDWSKFGDYELDFGIGKAVWVSLADVPLEDLMILMNTRENDGIEAWVYLEESDMPYFQQDHHIQMLLA